MSDRPTVDRRSVGGAEAVDSDVSSTPWSRRSRLLFFCIVLFAASFVSVALDLGVIVSALLGAVAFALSDGFDRWRAR